MSEAFKISQGGGRTYYAEKSISQIRAQVTRIEQQLARARNDGRISQKEYEDRMNRVEAIEQSYANNAKDYLAVYGKGNPFDQFGNANTNYPIPQYGYRTQDEDERRDEITRLRNKQRLERR